MRRSVPPMNEITRVLSALEQGAPDAAEQLLPLVYEELRKLAARRTGPKQMIDRAQIILGSL